MFSFEGKKKELRTFHFMDKELIIRSKPAKKRLHAILLASYQMSLKVKSLQSQDLCDKIGLTAKRYLADLHAHSKTKFFLMLKAHMQTA